MDTCILLCWKNVQEKPHRGGQKSVMSTKEDANKGSYFCFPRFWLRNGALGGITTVPWAQKPASSLQKPGGALRFLCDPPSPRLGPLLINVTTGSENAGGHRVFI